jgi:AcrR family transcriptional regulator
VEVGVMVVIRPHRADARENRARVLEAARTVFQERGFGAEMKEIAERAGVGIGTVYRNFATKDELIDAILQDFVVQFRHVIDESIALPPVEAVRHYIRGAMVAFTEHGLLSRAILSGDIPACAGPHVHELMGDTRMRSVFERGIASGEFRAGLDPVSAAAMAFALVVPVAAISASEERSLELIEEQFAETFLRGIGA